MSNKSFNPCFHPPSPQVYTSYTAQPPPPIISVYKYKKNPHFTVSGIIFRDVESDWWLLNSLCNKKVFFGGKNLCLTEGETEECPLIFALFFKKGWWRVWWDRDPWLSPNMCVLHQWPPDALDCPPPCQLLRGFPGSQSLAASWPGQCCLSWACYKQSQDHGVEYEDWYEGITSAGSRAIGTSVDRDKALCQWHCGGFIMVFFP